MELRLTIAEDPASRDFSCDGEARLTDAHRRPLHVQLCALAPFALDAASGVPAAKLEA
jgi:hypothetical protein